MTQIRLMTTILLVAAFAGSSAWATAGEAGDEPVDFNRDVRPIFSDACFACHGPDSGQRQADLRLDLQEGLFRSQDGVTVVDAKNAANSELLTRIESGDADLVMPPQGSGKALTAAQKQTIRRWIEQGATWKGHWAYILPQRPKVPDVEVSPTANDIDRFIQNRLDRQKLTPLAQADPVTLVRRLSFDLTGLPPTPEQVAAFAATPTPEAWQALIDELLSSHHYGERMTELWLDQVRYADTNGIHGDNHREVWMYRDYVIDAFNSNMPFDRFTIEQLAGDLLPEPSDEQKIASGYNRLLMTTREGGAQPKEYLAKYSADRVRNAASVWLGATMACCECHDHKYDPYSLRDFYQFAAFFADIMDVPVGIQPATKMPSRTQQQQLSKLDQKIAQLQTTLDTQTEELDSALNSWVAEQQQKLRTSPKIWHVQHPAAVMSTGGQVTQILEDHSVLTSGDNPKQDTYEVVLPVVADQPQRMTGIRLETLRHDSMTNKSLSRVNGNFVLSEISVRIANTEGTSAVEASVPVSDAVASYEQDGWPVRNALDGKPDTGWAVDGHLHNDADRTAVFQFEKPAELAAGQRLIVTLQQTSVDYHNIGRFRISTTAAATPGLNDNGLGLPPDLLAAVEAWPSVSDDQRSAVATHFRSVTPLLADARSSLSETKTARETLDKCIPEMLVTRTQTPREIRVLARGNWMDDSGDLVEPAVPHFLQQLNTASRGSRMDLAEWLVSDDNPLVARVFVNRLWQQLFGRGIVKSADDFGSQGSWPTHPDLLDWLAVEFRESGWDIRHMIRLIVSSDAYRRSSVFDEQLVAADPFNNWLARQSRYRLEAESIRDMALQVSGLLVDQVGGPSVKPYQPAGYWAHLNFPTREWEADTGAKQYRRGLYTYWCRTFLHPAMKSFDAPTREECTVERSRSNNSLQALVLLNDPTFVEAARALAQRVLVEGRDSDESRLDRMYRLCLSRAARPEEVSVLLELLDSQRTVFAASGESVSGFLTVGQKSIDRTVDQQQLAAWTAVARTVLNLHETITRP
ncbi:MAG: PSD1 and planctomycete cytochrome C domain-containing protein [Planctomycetaceae bacterium]